MIGIDVDDRVRAAVARSGESWFTPLNASERRASGAIKHARPGRRQWPETSQHPVIVAMDRRKSREIILRHVIREMTGIDKQSPRGREMFR